MSAIVRISRIVKDFRDTVALNNLIALWGFVDDHTFLTKAGAVGAVYRVKGLGFECLDHGQRHDVAHRFEQALRQLGESFRIYQYVLKCPASTITAAPHPHPVVQEALARRTAYFAAKADALFELELYLIVLYEGGVPSRSWPDRVRAFAQAPAAVLRLFAEQLTRAVGHLHRKAEAFAVQLGETAQPCSSTSARRFECCAGWSTTRRTKRTGPR